MMSADPYMLIGKGVGSSSEEETVIVAVNGHPVDPHHFIVPRPIGEALSLQESRTRFDSVRNYQYYRGIKYMNELTIEELSNMLYDMKQDLQYQLTFEDIDWNFVRECVERAAEVDRLLQEALENDSM